MSNPSPTTPPINLQALADRVYRLFLADLRLQQVRAGQQSVRR